MVQTHEIYMRRAIELANKGRFKVSPNPRVGAVIVHNDSVIGEGYHEYLGGPHAEVNAIMNSNPIPNKSETKLYTTLFPCNECVKMIIQSGIKEIIYVDDKNINTESGKASRILLDLAKVKYNKYNPSNKQIKLTV